MLGYSRDELLRLSAPDIESFHTPGAIADTPSRDDTASRGSGGHEFLTSMGDELRDEGLRSAHMVHRPLSLVLVEDNPNVATALQAALEQAGHSVRSFADAPSVLAGVSILTPDAILIDIGLPGMDGYELAAKLKQQTKTKGALLVAVTGFKRRDRVAGDAFDHYFNKPVDVDALLAVLEHR